MADRAEFVFTFDDRGGGGGSSSAPSKGPSAPGGKATPKQNADDIQEKREQRAERKVNTEGNEAARKRMVTRSGVPAGRGSSRLHDGLREAAGKAGRAGTAPQPPTPGGMKTAAMQAVGAAAARVPGLGGIASATSGVLAGGAGAAAAGVALPAAVVGALILAANSLRQTTNQLADYSPDISRQRAEDRAKEIQVQARRARESGAEFAAFDGEQAELNRRIGELVFSMKEEVVPGFTAITDSFNALLEKLGAPDPGGKTTSPFVEAIRREFGLAAGEEGPRPDDGATRLDAAPAVGVTAVSPAAAIGILSSALFGR